MLAHTGASTGLIYICNPNNPTASITDRRGLESFIGQLPAATKVAIDETYHDYTRTLKPIDSQTNFALMNVHHPAEEVIEHFRRHNILIGPHFPTLDTYIRVSLGTPEEMRAFWETWDLRPWVEGVLRNLIGLSRAVNDNPQPDRSRWQDRGKRHWQI
jgi:histidinol-phosphate/aromatic aminotransferase/cobyric acid decarboxylase-like protein